MKSDATATVVLEPTSADRLKMLCGPMDDNLRHLERRLNVTISCTDNSFAITGAPGSTRAAETVLKRLYVDTQTVKGKVPDITPEQVNLALAEARSPDFDPDSGSDGEGIPLRSGFLKTRKGLVKARTRNQAEYLRNIALHDVTFGIGPAGTGKTYLAVAAAVDALERQEIRRILLTRPAVEAGEKLGFLPGDLSQKVDPYLRPLYDALFEMLGFEKVEKLMERQVIEIAPLAYMRGRTLNDAFIILDESQNTTIEQMKMFLTRIGFNSKAVLTGDITQIDLPRSQKSGLRHAAAILRGVEGLAFSFFETRDIVRHPVVARIVSAYEKAAAEEKAGEKNRKDAPEPEESMHSESDNREDPGEKGEE